MARAAKATGHINKSTVTQSRGQVALLVVVSEQVKVTANSPRVNHQSDVAASPVK